jgi:hypothetical protein
MPLLKIFRVAAAAAVIACSYEPLTSTVLGSAPTIEWAKIAEPQGLNGGAGEIAVLLDGTVYAVGPYLVHLDSEGNLLKATDLTGILTFVSDIKFDRDRNYYVTGSQGIQFYLAKYSSAGQLIWERTSSGTTQQMSGRIAIDQGGNIVVAGGSYGAVALDQVTFPPGVGGPLLCKYTPDGVLLWAKRVEVQGSTSPFYGFSGRAVDLALDSAGNIITTGYLSASADFGNGAVASAAGAYLAKFGPDGDVAWVRSGYGAGGVAVDQR